MSENQNSKSEVSRVKAILLDAIFKYRNDQSSYFTLYPKVSKSIGMDYRVQYTLRQILLNDLRLADYEYFNRVAKSNNIILTNNDNSYSGEYEYTFATLRRDYLIKDQIINHFIAEIMATEDKQVLDNYKDQFTKVNEVTFDFTFKDNPFCIDNDKFNEYLNKQMELRHDENKFIMGSKSNK